MTAAMSSSCRMFVYRDMTSAVIKSALVGRGRSFFNKTEEMLLSLMCNGRLLARGWIKRVIQDNKLLVGPSHSETTGLRGKFGLCIFGQP